MNEQDLEGGFQRARHEGQMEIVRFLTTSSELKAADHRFVNIQVNNEDGCQEACRKGNLEVVRFLATSPELNEAGHEWWIFMSKEVMGFDGRANMSSENSFGGGFLSEASIRSGRAKE